MLFDLSVFLQNKKMRKKYISKMFIAWYKRMQFKWWFFKKSAYNLYNTIKGNSVLKQMCNNFGNIENTTIVLLYQMKFLGKYKYGLLN